MSNSDTIHEEVSKVAALIASLDRTTAEALLDQFTPQQRAEVQAALVHVEEISEAEHQIMLEDFLETLKGATFGSIQPASIRRHSLDADGSPVKRAPIPADVSLPNACNDQEGVLQHASTETLLELLRDEHPQTIAAIVASLAPSKSLDLMQRLSPDRKVDVIRRLAELETPDDEILDEVQQELRQQVSRVRPQKAAGWNRLRTILQTADASIWSELLHAVASQDAQLAERLQEVKAKLPSGTHGTEADGLEDAYKASAAFDRLVDLEPGQLEDVFTRFPRQVSVLALAGASQPCRKDVLARLSEDTAARLRSDLAKLGPVRLSEIHRSQAEIVRFARSIANHRNLGRRPGRLTFSA